MYLPAESKESYLERGLVCLGTEWLFHSNWQDLLGIFLNYFLTLIRNVIEMMYLNMYIISAVF